MRSGLLQMLWAGVLAVLMGWALDAAATTNVVVEGKSPEENGLAVAQEADRRASGFVNYRADLTMVLRNKHGDESTRAIRSRTLEVDEDGDKSLVIFETPRTVKGTAFLTFAHKDGSDDQWIYMPAIKRVKRIASDNKSGPFMGSEFAYEDISSQEVEEYTYKYLRTETVDGQEFHVVERYPVDEKSGYTRQITWIDTEEYRTYKVEYYDRKDSLLKTLQVSGFQQYLDQYWYPDSMHMVNHQTGKSTRLDWENYEFRVDIDDGDFNKNSLARAR